MKLRCITLVCVVLFNFLGKPMFCKSLKTLMFGLVLATGFTPISSFAQACGTYGAAPCIIRDVYADNSPNEEISWGVRLLNLPYLPTNSDPPVFVIDSGVHKHPSLNVVAQDVIQRSSGPTLPEGCYTHGTFVAGIIGGKGPQMSGGVKVPGSYGTRPGTPIHSIAFYNDCPGDGGIGSITFNDLKNAFLIARAKVQERCISTQDCRPGIVNLSFNGSITGNVGEFKQFLSDYIVRPKRDAYPGILVVHSAGNQGLGTVGTPGFIANDISDPNDGYMVVGAIDSFGQQMRPVNDMGPGRRVIPEDGYLTLLPGNFVGNIVKMDTLDTLSNFGRGLSMWAPGKNLVSSVAYKPFLVVGGEDRVGGPDCPQQVKSAQGGNCYGIGYASGTSFAAPFVAAHAAYLRESIANWTTPAAFEQILKSATYSNGATDDEGNPIIIPRPPRNRPAVGGDAYTPFVPYFFRARPTAEFLMEVDPVLRKGGGFSGTFQPVSEKRNIAPSSYLQQDSLITLKRPNRSVLKYESSGASHCEIRGYDEGADPFASNPVTPTLIYQKSEFGGPSPKFSVKGMLPIDLNPGYYFYTMTCYDKRFGAGGSFDNVDMRSYEISSTAIITFRVVD
jgi:hypothetical protein